MAGRAFILGGTGNVGAAIAHSLAVDGWQVTVAGKTERPAPAGFEHVVLDRDEEGSLSVANGFDLVVDVVPFEAAHAEQLLELDTGALVAISSASVYADEQGRTLDEAQGVDDFPEFPVPIPETQSTVEPGDDMAKAERELGYHAATSWAEALPRQVRWLIEATSNRDWREVLTRGADYLKFDYEDEDELVADLRNA